MKELASVLVAFALLAGASWLALEKGGDRELMVSPPDAVAEGFTREVLTRRWDRAKNYLAEYEALAAYDWPGNVRELRNVADRLSVFGTDPVTVDQLPSAIVARSGAVESAIVRLSGAANVMPLRDFKSQSEKEYIESVLRRTNWNVTKAAELLDVQRTHLHERITALGIVRPA